MVEIKNNSIAVTRDGSLYLYKFMNNKNYMYGLSSNATKEFDEYWDSNLFAKDYAWGWFTSKAMDKDIIYVFDVIDEIKFLDTLRRYEYIKYSDLFKTNNKFCKLSYERKTE